MCRYTNRIVIEPLLSDLPACSSLHLSGSKTGPQSVPAWKQWLCVSSVSRRYKTAGRYQLTIGDVLKWSSRVVRTSPISDRVARIFRRLFLIKVGLIFQSYLLATAACHRRQISMESGQGTSAVVAAATGPTGDREPTPSSGSVKTPVESRSSAAKRASMMMSDVKRRTPWKLVRKTASGVFSHLGLASLVIAYTIMGGFLFQ